MMRLVPQTALFIPQALTCGIFLRKLCADSFGVGVPQRGIREENVIVLKDINKTLGQRQVLKDISFHIMRGERVGLIGRNGAGKTTLLKILSGTLLPDRGFVRVHAKENVLSSYDTLRAVVYASGDRGPLWDDLKIRESFDHCIRMYRGKNHRMQEIAEVFEIEELLGCRPNELSLGERMRCGLAYALLARPELLLTDEALNGLDASVKHKIMEYLTDVSREQEMTVIHASHNFSEIEKLCDRILLIDEGKILFDGSIKSMMRQYAPLYEMTVLTENGWIPDFEDLPVDTYRIESGSIRIRFDKKKLEAAELLRFLTARCAIRDIRLTEPDLEATVLRIYEQERDTAYV